MREIERDRDTKRDRDRDTQRDCERDRERQRHKERQRQRHEREHGETTIAQYLKLHQYAQLLVTRQIRLRHALVTPLSEQSTNAGYTANSFLVSVDVKNY